MAARWGRFPGKERRPGRIGRLATFPYPKLLGGIREMTAIPLIDRLVLRAIVARVGAGVEATAGARLYANRLATLGPGWSLVEFPEAFGAFRSDQLDSLERSRWRFTLLTDVRAYYPHIQRDLLMSELRRCSQDVEALGTLAELLAVWHERDRLKGLPIGDESCGVLSLPVMMPTDALLDRVADDHYIYSDDMTVFAATETAGYAMKASLEEHLAERGFALNAAKTKVLTDPDDVVDEISNLNLGYIENLEVLIAETARERTYDLWHELVTSVALTDSRQRSEVHFVLNRLRRANDPYAIKGLLARRDIMQMSPKEAIRYLMTVAPLDSGVYETMLQLVQDPLTPANEALALHAFRWLQAAPRDGRLNVACERVLDLEDHAPTRAWAAMAARQAPTWSCEHTLEREEAEPDFTVCRALIASTRGSDWSPRLRHRVLRTIGEERVDMAAVCDYAERAA